MVQTRLPNSFRVCREKKNSIRVCGLELSSSIFNSLFNYFKFRISDPQHPPCINQGSSCIVCVGHLWGFNEISKLIDLWTFGFRSHFLTREIFSVKFNRVWACLLNYFFIYQAFKYKMKYLNLHTSSYLHTHAPNHTLLVCTHARPTHISIGYT